MYFASRLKLSCLHVKGVIASSRGARGPQARRIISLERVNHFSCRNAMYCTSYTSEANTAVRVSDLCWQVPIWCHCCMCTRSRHFMASCSACCHTDTFNLSHDCTVLHDVGGKVAQARFSAWHAHLQALCCCHSNHISRSASRASIISLVAATL